MKSGSRLDCVYIKNGDVVEQFARIASAGELDLQSGPDAFLHDFLETWKDRSVLLVSGGQTDQVNTVRETLKLQTLRRGVSRTSRIFSRPALFLRTLAILIRNHPKRILCGSSGELLWACTIYGTLAGVPVVHSRHNRVSLGSGSLYRRASIALDNACIKRAIGVVCHGPFLRKEILEIGYPTGSVHEFDVRLEAFRANATQRPGSVSSIRQGEVGILYSGRIEKLKGVFDLLEALEAELKERRNLVLLYAGTGSAAEELKTEIVNRDLSKNVRVLGRVPHHELAGVMKRCTLVVTPSRSRFAEGRCMVAMESLAVGTPVVAPNFGPFPLLVTHKVNGLLYKPDSIADLKEKVVLALSDKTLYAKLRSGADATARELLEPPLTFGRAVERAFAAASS